MVLDGFSTKSQGPTLTLTLPPGQILAIAGPDGAGKTKMLRTLVGHIKPAQGRLANNDKAILAGEDGFNRRATPQSLAKRTASKTSFAASALTATGLWDRRNDPIPQLTPQLKNRCELLGCLASSFPLIFIDEQLDQLDPWILPLVWELIEQKRREGTSFVIATSRPELMTRADLIVVLENQEPRFAGAILDLLRYAAESEIEVITMRQEGVRALVEPFEVSIRETETGMVLHAAEGQQLAARLLLEGYGDVKLVVHRQPKIEMALAQVLTSIRRVPESDRRA